MGNPAYAHIEIYCVCIYIYIDLCVYIYIYVCVCVDLCVDLCVCIYVCVYITFAFAFTFDLYVCGAYQLPLFARMTENPFVAAPTALPTGKLMTRSRACSIVSSVSLVN